MLEKLKQRWKVNTLNLILIIATFALGGSLCGYAGRKILQLTSLDKGFLYFIIYILLITLLWPIAVLIISIPLGQFAFFRRYLQRISKRVGRGKTITKHRPPTTDDRPPGIDDRPPGTSDGAGTTDDGRQTTGDQPSTKVAIFASGAGSNAKKIIEHFASSDKVKIALVVCNKPTAGVLDIAAAANIPTVILDRQAFLNGDEVLTQLKKHNINFIVLAGFLLKVPDQVIKAFPKKIVNIHPALLPKYGGKGMYGHFVHESVIANKDAESGISIHYADEAYDHGEIILQARCAVDSNDTPDTLAQKIHVLEHEYYAKTIAGLFR